MVCYGFKQAKSRADHSSASSYVPHLSIPSAYSSRVVWWCQRVWQSSIRQKCSHQFSRYWTILSSILIIFSSCRISVFLLWSWREMCIRDRYYPIHAAVRLPDFMNTAERCDVRRTVLLPSLQMKLIYLQMNILLQGKKTIFMLQQSSLETRFLLRAY